jgi:putative glycosyltransferase (TIGR04372 family)
MVSTRRAARGSDGRGARQIPCHAATRAYHRRTAFQHPPVDASLLLFGNQVQSALIKLQLAFLPKMTKLTEHEINIPPIDGEKFNIFGALLHSTVGDFTDHVLYCASVKALIPNARLDVYYRPNRPYKEAIISMAPTIDRAWSTEQPLPINLFDISTERSPLGPDDWYALGCAVPKLMILPSNGTFNDLASLPRITRLRVPNRDFHEQTLRGLVGDGWFVVLHYRELGYEFRAPTGFREANLEQIPKIIDRVTERGGQVVRIGHPQMSMLEARPGFVDLKNADFLLQAHAIARARCFFEASASGPASLALAQGVPTARCNQADLRCITSDQGFIVPQRVIHKSGKDLTRHLIETHQLNVTAIREHPELRYQALKLADLLEALDRLLHLTDDASDGWRDDTPPPPAPPIPGFYPGPAQGISARVFL